MREYFQYKWWEFHVRLLRVLFGSPIFQGRTYNLANLGFWMCSTGWLELNCFRSQCSPTVPPHPPNQVMTSFRKSHLLITILSLKASLEAKSNPLITKICWQPNYKFCYLSLAWVVRIHCIRSYFGFKCFSFGAVAFCDPFFIKWENTYRDQI